MKKLLTVLLLFGIVTASYSVVNIKLVKLSEVELPPGTITLVVGVELYPTYSWQIYSATGQFYVGNNLRDLTPVVTPTDPDVFTDANYNKTASYANGYCYFTFDEKVDNTGNTLTKNVWTQVLQFQFVYNKIYTGARATFSWTANGTYPLWGVEAWNTFLGSPYSVVGVQASMPADLVDMSLPVQMNKTIAQYSYDKGVTLSWTTQSEQNCAGFHILRGNSPNGGFEKVTADMIPGQGTSSSLVNYQFTDPNVKWDKTYYYKIQEISTQFMDTSKTFYGPLSVTTGKAPDKFDLSQNYPNPFNPRTEIAYKITEASKVTIKIYNLLGKEIKTLVDNDLPAGIYKAEWDGTDEFGSDTPSGLYLYRITAGDQSEMHRMTKMK
jgi:hypothetical protein